MTPNQRQESLAAEVGVGGPSLCRVWVWEAWHFELADCAMWFEAWTFLWLIWPSQASRIFELIQIRGAPFVMLPLSLVILGSTSYSLRGRSKGRCMRSAAACLLPWSVQPWRRWRADGVCPLQILGWKKSAGTSWHHVSREAMSFVTVEISETDINWQITTLTLFLKECSMELRMVHH